MKRRLYPSAAGGFTLIELMLGLALLAIIVALAVPSFSQLVHRYQMRAAALSMQSFMEVARAEAIIRGEPVELCPRAAEPGQCGEDYRKGWIVRLGNAAAPVLLRESAPLPATFSVVNRLGSSDVRAALRWRSDGSAGQNVRFQFCAWGSRGIDAYAVVLTHAGRSRLARGEGQCPGEHA